MKGFMCENFLLENKVAEKLYHDYAKNMPIYDYHCHLNPKEISENKKYRNITELWLGGDHYKWRAMRSNGVDEKYITGNAEDKEKFLKWAETMENCIGNPLYHWTHLELKRYFGINDLLNKENAEGIWNKCNELLLKDEFNARALIEKSNVQVICTTDDPVDSLEYHLSLKEDKNFKVKVLPTFRPDKAFNIEKETFLPWIESLSKVENKKIVTFKDLLNSLENRINFFHEIGCRVSDHALDPPVFAESNEEELEKIYQKKLNGEALEQLEVEKFKTAIMLFVAKKYAKLQWAMQLHMGTRRNNNTRMHKVLGPDTGFDTIADYTYIESLAQFLDKLDSTDQLPRTILYTLNPRDNEALGTLIGCFQGGGIPGKIQFGSGWWFNDQKDGMIRQMVALGNMGLLSRFVGMLTDSRSFLSYTRHEYFRRILCNLIAQWVENGEAPEDYKLLGKMVEDICFNNAKGYFK
ncbi:MAG: glucuronate isomerase, partial [Fusobacteriaceae bacterium]|nr:glucuronate isomerase [Fusobacteriaceae bacterium]